jgi:sporulation protein YlmC with PRC-barrel domain
MIRNFLATTATISVIATGAYSQTTTPAPLEPAPPVEMVKKAEGHLTSNVIGMTVYNGAGDEAENIGKVTDMVMSPKGQIEAIVIGVGGFLGIGRKDVAIQFDLVEWTEKDGAEFLIVETTAEALKAQREFQRAAYEPTPADVEVEETKPVTAEELSEPPVEQEASTDEAAVPPAEEEASTDDTATSATAPLAQPADEDAAD